MNKPYILHIETATPVCSVALSWGSGLLASRTLDEPNIHAARLTLLIEEVMAAGEIDFSALSAISVGKGPGSYTGLRIGVSTAKGLCYALDIPLLAVHTLDAMASGFAKQHIDLCGSDTLLVPMIDARRMEVYMATYDSSLVRVMDVAANIIDEHYFSNYPKGNGIVLFGNGADKFVDLFAKHDAVRVSTGFKNSAEHFVELSQRMYGAGQFEDIAYFEPFYLKEFVATTPKARS